MPGPSYDSGKWKLVNFFDRCARYVKILLTSDRKINLKTKEKKKKSNKFLVNKIIVEMGIYGCILYALNGTELRLMRLKMRYYTWRIVALRIHRTDGKWGIRTLFFKLLRVRTAGTILVLQIIAFVRQNSVSYTSTLSAYFIRMDGITDNWDPKREKFAHNRNNFSVLSYKFSTRMYVFFTIRSTTYSALQRRRISRRGKKKNYTHM